MIRSSDGWGLFVADTRATLTTAVITIAWMVMLQTLTMPPIRNWISIAFTTRNAVVHDEKRIWTSVDGSHYVGEHGQRSHQNPNCLPKLVHCGAVRY
jgi:hypothetical protein